MVDIQSEVKNTLLSLAVGVQEDIINENDLDVYTHKIMKIYEDHYLQRDVLPRYYLSGVDKHEHHHFINSELTPEKAQKRAKEILKAFPNRYERVYIETADKRYKNWVVKEEDEDKWKQLITKC